MDDDDNDKPVKCFKLPKHILIVVLSSLPSFFKNLKNKDFRD